MLCLMPPVNCFLVVFVPSISEIQLITLSVLYLCKFDLAGTVVRFGIDSCFETFLAIFSQHRFA